MNTHWKAITGIITAGVALAGFIVWVVYFNAPEIPVESTTTFGVSDSRTSVVTPSVGDTTNVNGTLPNGTQTPVITRVFKISDGPVAGATLLETSRPTSTIARFVMATNGHTFDFLIDSQGAVPKNISNTTIPGIAKVFWSENGRGGLFQYIDKSIIKTVYTSLLAAGATTSPSSRIQFLPNGITALAVSPDGGRIAYILKGTRGAEGYTSKPNGAETSKLFSLPLFGIQLMWPSTNTLMAQSAPATGIGGVVFSIDSKTGGWTPLIYANSITAIANTDFSKVVYQAVGEERFTYAQTVKTGLSTPLSYAPVPELCSWSIASSTILYCAVPLSYAGPGYLDALHYGINGPPMSLVQFDLQRGRSTIIATPGTSTDGGEAAEITNIALSANNKYLLYIRKGDRSLWGVRLKD